MKKFVSLVLTSLVCINCLADSRTAADAQAIASSFGKNISADTRALSLDEPTLAFTGKKNLQNLYYVFNYGEAAYVIVAADDRATTILGYSDNGSFSMENLPDGARWMLKEYDKALSSLAESDYQPVQTRATRATSAVEPLLGNINFDQEAPYNTFFPKVGNSTCVTGCLATAIATIVAYHRYPEKGNGSVSYQWSGQELSFDYDANPFDWDNILPTYNGGETEEQINAIGNLMLACSYGLQSNLGTIEQGGTGASIAYIDMLFKNLNYDKGAKLLSRDLYSTVEWTSAIDAELESNRPVFYLGYTQQSAGHAFVLDGRDENGLYHFNWGWGGHSNGYFTLDPVTGLAPSSQGAGGGEGGFGQGQMIMTGIQPDKGNKGEPNMVVRTLYDYQNNIVYAAYNYGFGNFSGEIGLGVYDEEGNLIETRNVSRLNNVEYLYGATDKRNDKDFKYDLALIRPVMKLAGNKEFEPIPIPLNMTQGIIVEKNEESGELEYGHFIPMLNYVTLDNFELVGKAYDKESAEFSVTITNHHETEELFGPVAIYIENKRSGKDQIFQDNMLEIAVKPGETKTFIIDTVEKLNIGNGGANAWILFCDNAYFFYLGEEENDFGSHEFYVNKAVTGSPELYLTSLSIVNNPSRQIHYGDLFTLRMRVDNKGSYGKLETAVFVFNENGTGYSLDYQCVKERCYYQGSNTIEFEMNLTNLDVNKKYMLAPAYVKPKASSFDWFTTENGKDNYIIVELLPAIASAIDEVKADDGKKWWIDNSRLNVKILSEEGTVDIYRLDGSLVATNPLPCGFSVIDIAPLPQGVYVVKINDGDIHAEGKFVK